MSEKECADQQQQRQHPAALHARTKDRAISAALAADVVDVVIVLAHAVDGNKAREGSKAIYSSLTY